MAKMERIKHVFVERVPSPLEDAVLYISIEFGTAIHKCCCGCGEKVVTPLTPLDWVLVYDGQTVSLYPSIGRWSAPCRSHYWIRNDCVMWSYVWPKTKIDFRRQHDAAVRDTYFGISKAHAQRNERDEQKPATPDKGEFD